MLKKGYKMRFTKLLIASAMLLSFAALAEDAIQLDLAAKPFGPQKEAVVKAVADEKYSEITLEKRTKVTEALGRISAVLAGDKPFSSVDAGSRQQLLADQQLINTALVDAKRDSRMVCTKEYTIGSNMPKRVCITAAEQKRQYEQAQQALKANDKSMQVNFQSK